MWARCASCRCSMHGSVLSGAAVPLSGRQGSDGDTAGKLDSKDEDPRKAAARELLEETGAVAEELIELGMFLPACAYSDEAIHMYAAKSLTFREQKLDADEFLNVFTMPLEQAVQKVLAGEIWDAKTQTALLKVWLLRQQGRL